MKIKVCKDGPYIVTGDVPLYRKTIVPKDGLLDFGDPERVPTPEKSYALCRCGKSKSKPFCDGAHAAAGTSSAAGFDGTETADRAPFRERASWQFGQGVDLMDDDRCAFVRFCHRQHGSVWELTDASGDPQNAREAMEGASACPAGRLVAVTKQGEAIEPELPAEITVIEDPQRSCSGGFYVSGGIPLEGADGDPYETVNRYVLCRCGFSFIKPFCDAQHVVRRFRD